MELVHGDAAVAEERTAIQPSEKKQISITGAAGLYVCSLLLGGLTLFGYFFLPHSGLLLGAVAVATAIVVTTALYSVRLVVNAFQARRP